MGDITRFRPSSMPSELAAAVRLFTSAFNPAYAECAVHPAEPHALAAAWLRRRQAFVAEPSEYEHCHAWFEELCGGINGVNEYVFEQRARAIWSMCRDLPACVWCEQTVHGIWSRTSFLPTPGECREVLTAYLLPLQHEIRALERIAEAKPRPPPVARESYVPQLPPEFAVEGPAHQGPQRDFAGEFEAKHGRAPGSLSEAAMQAVRRAAAANREAQGLPPLYPSEPRD